MLKSDLAQTLIFAVLLVGLGFVLRGCYDTAKVPIGKTMTIHRADTTVSLRPDSEQIKVSLILPKAEVIGRANRADTLIVKDSGDGHTELTVGIDTIGFFGKDSLQITPDTANLRYNLYRNEFALEYYFGIRAKDTLLKYIVRDSVINNSDSTTTTKFIPTSWYEKPLFVFSGGIVFAVLLKVLFHL